jgi:hypothetical protein
MTIAPGDCTGNPGLMVCAMCTSLFSQPTRAVANTELSSAISVILFACLSLTHTFLPEARKHTSKFFTLSQYNAVTGQYAVGAGDFHFVFFCIVLLNGVRIQIMKLFALLARKWGMSKNKDIIRFTEQVWVLAYYNVLWPFGMVCISTISANLQRLTVFSTSIISHRISLIWMHCGLVGHSESLMGQQRHTYCYSCPTVYMRSLSSTLKPEEKTIGKC